MLERCDWPVSYAACGGTAEPEPGEPALTGCDALDALKPEQRARFEEMAAELLWHWTARTFGVCEVTVRPCRGDCIGANRWATTFWGRGPYPWGGGLGSWVPVLIGGQWYNLGCGCGTTCNCGLEGPSSLALPGPIAEVTRVTIDGEALDPDEYRVMYGRVLVRTDGTAWPVCQDLLSPATAPDTFEVVYQRGVPVPTGGQVAAGVLACELAKAACGDSSCQLPDRVRSITRQGVSMEMEQIDFSDFQVGRTGIWLIDSWVGSVTAPRPMAGVASPDIPRSRGSASWPRT